MLMRRRANEEYDNPEKWCLPRLLSSAGLSIQKPMYMKLTSLLAVIYYLVRFTVLVIVGKIC